MVMCFIKSIVSYNKYFNNWACVGIKENIDFYNPYVYNVGNLPLVLWKDKKTDKLISTLNICKHMGSKFDKATITENGCLKCPYHGLEMDETDKFGETIEHEGKIFWAYKPITKPPNTPFYNNKNYIHSYIQIDMKASLTDCAFNTMDLRHPEFVHGNIFGFGSTIPAKNIKQYLFSDRIGLEFKYETSSLIKNNDNNIKDMFNMFILPSFIWSKVPINNNKFAIVTINLLPIEENKTRWFVTISHNYMKNNAEKIFMKTMAYSILSQDYTQMENQATENKLKKLMVFTPLHI
jgi:phenylpropionate dioxygenase-like ring-hydroxylating dioxygenase large terminal subunit